MFLGKNHHEAYWNSYRLLESQLLRLSHSICFDDTQINVYSSELADIINSACIKIESLAKDIYEDHIWPFQEDNDIVPPSFTDKKFKIEKWTRDNWKFDYNCLVEIDHKFSLSKKRIELKTERFHFHKYGSVILPFAQLHGKETRGGYWEYSKRDPWHFDDHRFQLVSWLGSYQSIKHNYIQSIPEHGTVKNVIMALAAFYLLCVCHSCLPTRKFELEEQSRKFEMDFGSELFFCPMCYYLSPPCVIDSEEIQWIAERKKNATDPTVQDIFKEQDLLNDIDGYPFLIILDEDARNDVLKQVNDFCVPRNLKHFDVAPYDGKNGQNNDAGYSLYVKLQIIKARSGRCISFNAVADHVYDNYEVDIFEYEKSKYRNKTAAVLSDLKLGDRVDAVFNFDEKVSNGEVVKLDDYSVDLSVEVNGKQCITSQSKANIICIRKVNK